jgi:hypothetical protein
MFDTSAFRYSGHRRACFPVPTNPEIKTCKPPPVSMRVKYRSTDEILSEDPESVTPVDVGGGGGGRNAKDSSSTPLNLYKR